jgi:ankyrin repeat protein
VLFLIGADFFAVDKRNKTRLERLFDNDNEYTPQKWLIRHFLQDEKMAAQQQNILKKVLIRAIQLWPGKLPETCPTNTVKNLLYQFSGDEEIYAYLIQSVEVNFVDSRGRTPLHTAAALGSMTIVNLVFKDEDKFGLINAVDINGETALHVATKNNFAEIVEALLNHGVDVNVKYPSGQTALHIAARKDFESILVSLLEQDDADVEAKDPLGRTPLHLASRSVEVTKLLLEHGADVGTKDNFGFTPLHHASTSVEVTKLLLKRGANADEKGILALTPWILAFLTKSDETLKALLDVSAVNDVNTTALKFYLGGKSAEAVKLLQDSWIDPMSNLNQPDIYLGRLILYEIQAHDPSIPVNDNLFPLFAPLIENLKRMLKEDMVISDLETYIFYSMLGDERKELSPLVRLG